MDGLQSSPISEVHTFFTKQTSNSGYQLHLPLSHNRGTYVHSLLSDPQPSNPALKVRVLDWYCQLHQPPMPEKLRGPPISFLRLAMKCYNSVKGLLLGFKLKSP